MQARLGPVCCRFVKDVSLFIKEVIAVGSSTYQCESQIEATWFAEVRGVDRATPNTVKIYKFGAGAQRCSGVVTPWRWAQTGKLRAEPWFCEISQL